MGGDAEGGASGAAGEAARVMELSVIVPARNEEAVLPGFLASVLAQSEPGFALGVEWELIVVNETRGMGRAGLRMRLLRRMLGDGVDAPALDLARGAGLRGRRMPAGQGLRRRGASGCFLLMRIRCMRWGICRGRSGRRQAPCGAAELLAAADCDGVLAEDGDAAGVLGAGEYLSAEAGERSGEQAGGGEWAISASRAGCLFRCGGHRALGREVLEDVALARAVKRGGKTIRFRYVSGCSGGADV